jgi:hypothetical protein
MQTSQPNQHKDIFEYNDQDKIEATIKRDGLEQVDKQTRVDRLSICNTCEFLRQPWHQCTHCMCWMPLKARLPKTKCPIGKW